MIRRQQRKAVGWALFAGAAVGGAALGFLAERRAAGDHGLGDDPEWEELSRDPATATAQVTSFDGTRLHVDVAGAQGGDTVVLVHGFGMSAGFWHYQVRDLQDEFLVVAYDQRGHARSAPAEGGDYSFGALGRDLDAVLAQTVPEQSRVLLCGHSMGAMSIMSWAQAHAETTRRQVAGAVLCNTASGRVLLAGLVSGGVAAVGALERTLGFRRRGRHIPLHPRSSDLTYALTHAVGLSGEASPAHVQFVEQQFIELPVAAKAAFARGLGSLDLDKALPHLEVPTLVLVGEKDRVTPPSHSRRLQARLPNARLLELEGTGHMAPLEAHEQVTTALRQHAREVMPARAAGVRRAGRKRGRQVAGGAKRSSGGGGKGSVRGGAKGSATDRPDRGN